MFRTVFPSNIRSSRLYIQHQVYVIQVVDCMLAGTSWNISCVYIYIYIYIYKIVNIYIHVVHLLVG